MLTGDVILFHRVPTKELPNDDGLSVVHVDDRDRLPNESLEAFHARMEQMWVPAGVACRWAKVEDLPKDRTNRQAWRDKDGRVVINLDINLDKVNKP